MGKVNCGGFFINEEKLKVIDGALTKQNSVKITNKGLAGCGGLIIDLDVFKFDDKTHTLTIKEAKSVLDFILAPCGGLKLDSNYFKINKDGTITLKDIEVSTMSFNVPTTKVTFESLDDFTIEVNNENGEVVEPVEDKIYQLERMKLYTYKAVNLNNEIINGTITTTSRQANLIKTIEF